MAIFAAMSTVLPEIDRQETSQTSFEATLRAALDRIVPDRDLHARWLNTLSYMEHIGATKIARTQSGPRATYMGLKHAAEEARHAFFLKKLALRVQPETHPDYAPEHLLSPVLSQQYLNRLDIAASRLARKAGLTGRKMHDLAYLLVTYAIEVRADDLYPVYQDYLVDYTLAKLSVQGIINEEEGHLAEMETMLAAYPAEIQALKEDMLALEGELCGEWLKAVLSEVA